jgi:GntR family transcriptional repressor for pyruvate dehydrogenase complex
MMTETARTGRVPRLYQQVAERLARAIAAGTHAVGDRLPAERELAAAYAVSRPTMREAIIALELDGLVEVRMGSGVYVLQPRPRAAAAPMDVGAFELTEARLLIEGETAALAASLITEAELAELDRLLAEMATAVEADRIAGQPAGGPRTDEVLDEQFHLTIARATQNSALAATVEQLWQTRNRSPQCARLFEKSRSWGVRPVIAEHRAILEALRARDPARARAAMRDHLSRVLDYMLDATEVEAVEAARATAAARRRRFAARSAD